MSTEENKQTSGSKKKMLMGIIVVIVIICVAVGAALMNGTSSPAEHEDSPAQSEETGESSMENMDFDKMFQSSLDTALEALDADPENATLLAEVASTYYMWAVQVHESSMKSTHSAEELYQKSAEYYEKATEIDPSNLQTKAHLGYTYFGWAQSVSTTATADTDQAKELYGKSIELFDQAAEGAGDSISDAEVSNMTINKAIALFALGQLDEAITTLETHREKDKENATLLINLGIFYEAKEDTDKAVECYELAESIAQENGDENLASAAHQRKDVLAPHE